MKKTYTTLLSLLVPMLMTAQNITGWRANYPGVMLQGFYWDSYSDTQWTKLTSQADELAATFDLIWIPQSGNCGGQSMGYDDLYWFPGGNHYTSSFGTEQELRTMIQTFKSKGLGTIADVVINHRKNFSNWVDFPAETYKGVTYQLKSTDIVGDDYWYDSNNTKRWTRDCADAQTWPLSQNNDTGEGWSGLRDLDHKSTNVQDNVKAYTKMLLDDLGYIGFRYDMVKGYSGSFTATYNNYAQPQFSVGECWDSSNTIKNWIDATSKTSAAFDFQFRYTVRNAANNGNWAALAQQNDGNWPLVSSNFESGSYRQYAVTFVENHDTERRSNAEQDPLKKDTLAANAYLLAMPGTPCVFFKHWKAYKQEIANMIAVRKAVGITNVSKPIPAGSTANYYAVNVAGSGDKKLLCVVGKGAGSYTPSDSRWKKVISGYHYAYYVQGIEPSAITLPEVKPDEQPQDGVYGGVPSFCTVNAGEICAFFEAPVTWGSQIYTWAWMDGGDGKDYVGTSWPGVSATQIGTADNGNKVFKWVSAKTTAPNNIIFSGAGNQTEDLPFTNGGYYTKDGCQATVTTGIAPMTVTDRVSRIYTLDGRLVPTTDFNALPRGIYIVNGKKVVR